MPISSQYFNPVLVFCWFINAHSEYGYKVESVLLSDSLQL